MFLLGTPQAIIDKLVRCGVALYGGGGSFMIRRLAGAHNNALERCDVTLIVTGTFACYEDTNQYCHIVH